MKKKFALYYEQNGMAHAILTSEDTYLRDIYVLSCTGAQAITKLSVAMLLSMLEDAEDEGIEFSFPHDEEKKFQEEYMWQFCSIDSYNKVLLNKKNRAQLYDEKPMFSDYEEECFLEFCAEQKALEILSLIPEDEEGRVIKALMELIG